MTTASGKPKQTLDTPVLIVDLDAMERNVDRISTTCQAAGVNWRPHMKGIKVPSHRPSRPPAGCDRHHLR